MAVIVSILDDENQEVEHIKKVCDDVDEANQYISEHEQDFADDPEIYAVYIREIDSELKTARKAVDIEWDVDDVDEYDEDIELPIEVEIPDDMYDEDEISDYLSDLVGFCHKGFKIVEDEPAE